MTKLKIIHVKPTFAENIFLFNRNVAQIKLSREGTISVDHMWRDGWVDGSLDN